MGSLFPASAIDSPKSTCRLDVHEIMREPARIIDDFFTIDGQDLAPLAMSGTAGWLTNFILDARIIALRRSAHEHIHIFTCDLASVISSAKDLAAIHEGSGLDVFTRNPEYKIPKTHPPPPLDLRNKSTWVFPIHRVDHWLFGAVDFSTNRLLFLDPFGVDSPSAEWAFMLLKNIVNQLRFSLGLEPLSFKDWESCVLDPKHPQSDTHSCGIYVLLAIERISVGLDPADIARFDPLLARECILRTILDEPIHPSAFSSTRSNPDSSPKPEELTPTINTDRKNAAARDDVASLSTPQQPTRSLSESALAAQKTHGGQVDPPRIRRSKSAANVEHQESLSSPFSSNNGTPLEGRRQRAIPRRKNESTDQKIAMLEADPFVQRYGPRMVVCKCQPSRAIHLPHDFNMQSWYKHIGRCKLRTLEQRGLQRLDRYFTPKSTHSSPRHSAVGTPSPSPCPSLLTTLRGRLNVFSCCGLNEEPYLSLAENEPDEHYGGVSPVQFPAINRQLFPWKNWSDLPKPRPDVPEFGNRKVSQQDFTEWEMELFYQEVRSLSVWKVDGSVIRSTVCSGRTANATRRCDACGSLQSNKNLRRLAVKAQCVQSLPPDDRDRHLARVAKYTNNQSSGLRKHRFLKQLSELENGNLLRSMDDDTTPGGIFVKLAFLARKRKFRLPDQVKGMVTMLVDKWERMSDPRGKMKHGIRYPPSLIHLSILLQTGGSSQNYNIFQELCGMPVFRHVLKLKAALGEGLHSPVLCLENLEGAKRLITLWKWKGPVALQTDCTKLNPDIAFTTDFAHEKGLIGHIVGSTFPLKETEIWNTQHILTVIKKIKQEGNTKVFAGYMRVTVLNIPRPETPPIVIAAYPTANNETGTTIADHILDAQRFCEMVGVAVLSFGADGAKAERLGQSIVRDSAPPNQRLTYSNPTYGIDIYAPIFKTGPAVAVQDVGHAQKTERNNEMSGTHLIVMGVAVICFSLLVELYLHSVGYAETAIKQGRPPARALKTRDIFKVDKQDDGAARRFFHALTLLHMTHVPEGNEPFDYAVLERFEALFAMHFIFGELFDAWLHRQMSHFERLRIALRAKFFLSIVREDLHLKCEKHHDIFNRRQSFISYESREILESLCDGLILLILAHAEFYPDIPLCPWEHGTESLEHLFGVARQVLGKFKYVEFIKHIKTVTIRQQLLASGKYNAAKRSRSASGYLFDNAHRKLTDEDIEILRTFPSRSDIDAYCPLAWDEAAAICRSLLKVAPPRLPLRPDLASQALSSTANEDADHELEDDVLISGAADVPHPGEDDRERGVGLSQPNASLDNETSNDDDNHSILVASRSTARLHALGQDLDDARKEVEDTEGDAADGSQSLDLTLPPRPVVHPHIHNLLGKQSNILAADGVTLLVPQMVVSRFKTQSSSGVRSETILSLKDSLQNHLRMLEDNAFSSDPPSTSMAADSSRLQSAVAASASEKSLTSNDMAALARHLMKEVGEILPVRRRDRELVWTGAPVETECPAVYNLAEELVDATDISKALKASPSKPEVWSLHDKIAAAVNPPLQVPNLHIRNVSPEHPLRTGSFVIAHTGSRVIVGEVLACFVKASGRHGWRGQVDTTAGLSYISLKVFVHAFQVDERRNVFVHTVPHPDNAAYSWSLFTHLPKAKLIYHLPTATMEYAEAFGCYILDAVSHMIWCELVNSSFRAVLSAFKDRRLPEETVTQPAFKPKQPVQPDAAIAPKQLKRRVAGANSGEQGPSKRLNMKDLRQTTLLDLFKASGKGTA